MLNKINSDDHVLIGFNGVYIYMGTYKLVHKYYTSWYPVHEVLVEDHDPTAEYKTFYELDTGLKKCVKIGDKLENFEQNNTIVCIPNVRSYENEYTLKKDCEKLRKLYLKELCNHDEDTAISLITSEDYIRETFSVENYMKEHNISSVSYDTFYNAALCNQKGKSRPIVLQKQKSK